MPSKKSRDAAIVKLRHALSLMDTKSFGPGLLTTLRNTVQDAYDLIQERDPLKRRTAFIILALQESTEIHTVALRGKEHERILIRDRPLYEWAMKQLHKLAEPAQEAA